MENTIGNYVTGSGATAAVYTPTNAGAGYTSLVDMFQTDASYYIPYFDVFPSLSSRTDAIIDGLYGDGSVSVISNSSWQVYTGKMGLGQAIFEASNWSGAIAGSVYFSGPWFTRGGRAHDTTVAGVEALFGTGANVDGTKGARYIVRVFCF